ncbi:MAG TPA: hypothetical protein DCE42_14215 [Myxococcales bacterium]|mgnify:CR=1 FL=1|nr:hypothetical protein [Deltaproteobacteria bacterium]HAA55914.1 hypothetical protein [Myxococcales bacterium]|tara:strand:+ start:27987 stop:28247 length:261 start_codon:yes stop_codon:yes gene_type:complete
MSQNTKNEQLTDKRFSPSSMHDPITQAFLDQAEKYNLRYLCEDCVYFDDVEDDCVHRYPTAPHRKAYIEDKPLEKMLIFCREFDIS